MLIKYSVVLYLCSIRHGRYDGVSSLSHRHHRDLMFFNLVTDIVTVVSLYILLYFIFSIVSMFLHMLHFLINIQQVLKLIELSTIIRYIQRSIKLYPTEKPDCSNKVCKWSLFMFAPAHPARFPPLFGVLSAPASVTPVVHGAVVC